MRIYNVLLNFFVSVYMLMHQREWSILNKNGYLFEKIMQSISEMKIKNS